MVSELQARTIASLGAVVSRLPNAQEVVALSLQTLRDATGASYLALHRQSDGDFLPDVLAWAGNKADPAALQDIEAGLIQLAVADRKPAMAELDAATSARIGLRRVAVLPILLQDRVPGSFTLGWEESAVAVSLDIAQSLANSVGLTLKFGQVYEAQQQYIEALEYLGSLSIELNLLPNAVEIVERAKEIICTLLNVERCAVFLAQDGIIHNTSSRGLTTAFNESLRGADLGVWPLHRLSEANPATGNRVLIFENSDSLPEDVLWRNALKQEGVQAIMMVLLRGHARVLGCLALYYDKPYTPTNYEIRLLEVLAAQLAVALDNMELNDANQQHSEIMELRVAERTQELAIALDKAEDADRLKTQLLSTVSHELRTPLAVIKAHATTTLAYYDRLPKERQIHYLTTINEETDRLTSLINSLLDMSRLEAGRLEIRPVRIDPARLANDLLDALQARYTDRMLRRSIPAMLPAIQGDPERLRQVIENLVDNAAKYSPPQTEIEIGAHIWDDGLEFWVKDQGNGMLPEQTKRVFDPFYQIDGSTKNARAGVGLGLAICKALIEEMHGRIWVSSEGLKKGSKFAFILPWASDGKTGPLLSTTP